MSINSVRNSIPALYAERDLANHSKNLDRSLAQLSSGLLIDHPAQAPAKFVLSEQLRTNISDSTQAAKNNENAISMLQVAESGLAEINQLLVHMQQVAIHAANEVTNDQLSLAANQAEINQSIKQIDLIVSNLNFGKRPLYKFDSGTNGYVEGDNLSLIKADQSTKSSGVDGYEVRLTNLPSRAYLRSLRALNDGELIDGGVGFTFSIDGKSVEYTTKPGQSLLRIIQEVNSRLQAAGLDLYLSADEKNILTVQHQEYGSQPHFQFFSTAEGLFSPANNSGSLQILNSITGTDATGTIGGEIFSAAGLTLSGKPGGRSEGLELRLQLNDEISAQTRFDQLGRPIANSAVPFIDLTDSNLIGTVHVKNSSLSYHIGSEYQNIAKFHIPFTDSRTIGEHVQNQSGIKNLNELVVTSFQQAQDSLLVLDKAVNDITSLQAELGAFQKNLLETNRDGLAERIENYVSADSKIRDADLAKSTSELVKNQLSRSVASDVLKSSYQRQSEVLRLFRG